MRKVIVISFLAVLITGCAIERKRNIAILEPKVVENEKTLLENVRKRNLSENGFFIEKAEIDVKIGESRDRVIGTIKFEKPDKYLVSVKTRSGIEAARIFISKDSIFINDRINRIMYFGSSGYIYRKFGISDKVLPVIFGDFISEKCINKDNYLCKDDRLIIDCQANGLIISYNIDCKQRKSTMSFPKNDLNINNIEIKFENFIKVGNTVTAKNISIKRLENNSFYKIRIKRILTPWNGVIEFVPGRNYERIELL